ncbi:hypothetical protein [Mucilaginibacter pedocola]|uniref:TPM domain-containing protein n=1 Tax=Mucilaginibacter pedocola TaxID=1792845 RepID=A0A1S9PBD1_9SPHI|nr:hypothetical protein [Mucilaginibacter pedocola]OOQ58127.1 hypothetical protein BC343_10780 [Mucilaginibacter pedocola]
MKPIYYLLAFLLLLAFTPPVSAQVAGEKGGDTTESKPVQRFEPMTATTLDSLRYQQILSYLSEAAHKPVDGSKQILIINAPALESGYCGVTDCNEDKCREAWVKQFVKRLGGKRKVDVFFVDARQQPADAIAKRWDIPYCYISISKMVRTFYRFYVPGCFGLIVLNTNRKYVSSYDNPRDMSGGTANLTNNFLNFYNRFCLGGG